jgi:hypothetical protein
LTTFQRHASYTGKGYKPKPKPKPRPTPSPTSIDDTPRPSSNTITSLPTISPECGYISCGFESLVENQLITANSAQAARLRQACRLQVSFVGRVRTTGINVFNSANVRGPGSIRSDFDLGSPNENCRPAGPGIGNGGGPNTNFPNCQPQGNMLILQSSGYSVRVALS